MFTNIINNRLTKWSEENGIINDAQAGFRKGRSTTDHIFTLHAAVEKHLLKNSKLYVAFIDLKKAYDTVNRSVLWSILIRHGMKGRMIRMLKAVYSTVQACVLCNEGASDFFECVQGLKQGCVMSPILFSLLINELANDIIARGRHGVSLGSTEIELFLLLFADDLTLMSSTIVGLQNQLNVLSTAAKRLFLTVNMDKSKVVVFRKGGFLASRERWYFNGNILEVVNSYKYLGLTFSTRHSFSASMEDVATRAKKSTTEILRTLHKIGCNSPDIFFKLFDTQVVPTLLYASEVWGYKQYDQIERVHLFACKRFLHVLNKTPTDVVYGELGRFPLWITAVKRCIKYWCKLLKQPDNMYSRKAYNMLLQLHNKGSTTWVTHVHSLLNENGFQQVWLFGAGNEKLFLNALQERLFSSFCHGWRNHLDSSERLSLYAQHKGIFEREKYVELVWTDVYRNALAQFRMGVSQINAHKHRFSTNEDCKLCPFGCETQETEIHFFFVCPLYTGLRARHSIELNVANRKEALMSILSKTDVCSVFKIARYLFNAFTLRMSEMNAVVHG